MQTLDIPQANDLNTVRRVVHAVMRGQLDMDGVADFTGYSRRHTQYRVHAARVLDFVELLEGGELRLTDRGRSLLDTTPGSTDERVVLSKAIERSPAIQRVAPDLLGRTPPGLEELADRLFKDSKLGSETARRRANGLLAWRRHVLGHVLKGQGRHPASAPPPARPAKPARPAPPPPDDGEQLSLF